MPRYPYLSFPLWVALVLLLWTLGATASVVFGADQKPIVKNPTTGVLENMQSGNNLLIPGTSTLTVSSLTAGRVPFMGTAGLFSDSNNLRYTTGAFVAENGAGAMEVDISGVAGNTRDIRFQTAGVNRWIISTTATAESGGNVGSDFQIRARTDAGAAIDNPLTISRIAGGSVTVNRPFVPTYTTTNVNGQIASNPVRIANTSSTGTHNARSSSPSIYGTITSGQTNSGLWTGSYVEALRNYVATSDGGTLTDLEGSRISYGHFNTDASTPTTTTVKGLNLLGYRSSGTIGTMVALDIGNGSTTITPTTGYGVRIANVGGTTAYAVSAGTGLVRFADTTSSSSSITGAMVVGDGSTVASNVGIGGGNVFFGGFAQTNTASAGKGYRVTTGDGYVAFQNDSAFVADNPAIISTVTSSKTLYLYASGSPVLNMELTDGALTSAGNITASVAGSGLRVKEGTNAKMGAATLVGGTVTVNTTAVTASSRIYLTSQADGGTPGFQRVSARVAATSFTITSSSGTDTSTVAWMIVEPAP